MVSAVPATEVLGVLAQRFHRQDASNSSPSTSTAMIRALRDGARLFMCSGYPTVVVLRADQREITRLSGGIDLSLYADLLDAALGDVEPMSDVLATLKQNPASLSAARVPSTRLLQLGCRRLLRRSTRNRSPRGLAQNADTALGSRRSSGRASR
jgi:hypothetical protein